MLTLIGFFLNLISSLTLLGVIIVWLSLSTGLVANHDLYIECATSFVRELAEGIERHFQPKRKNKKEEPKDELEPDPLRTTERTLPPTQGGQLTRYPFPDHYDQVREKLLQTMDILEGQ